MNRQYFKSYNVCALKGKDLHLTQKLGLVLTGKVETYFESTRKARRGGSWVIAVEA